jgi:hypothetical protein
MTSYFNGHIPLYVADFDLTSIENDISQLQIDVGNLQSDVSNIESEITDIETDIANITVDINQNMVQFYKNSTPPVNTTLTPLVYTIVTGYETTSSDIPGTYNNPFPGVLQYVGTQDIFTQINYMITCNTASGAFDTFFYIYKNNVPFSASKQANTLDSSSTAIHAISGTLLTPLTHNDTISLRALCSGAVSPVDLEVSNLTLSIIKIGVV